jgi:hypothetical protein
VIIGGIAFVGFIAAHLFAIAALRDGRADDPGTGRRFRRIA